MNALTIDTGLVSYSLNGDCEITFNPTDANFIEKIYSAFAELDKKQKDFTKQRESIGDDAEKLFIFMKDKDAEMRTVIDGVFNVPVCEAVFKNMNVFSLSRSGLPLWANLFLAVIDTCDSEVAVLSKRGSETVQKYIKKYKK